MRTNETLNGVLSFNNHNHPFSLVKLKQTYYYFQFCKSNEFFDERRSAVFVLPLNKEHQLRSGEGGQEVHDHTSCIYVLSSLQRVSDMMLGCLESLTCLITLSDLHFPQADSLCVYYGDPAYPVRVHLQSPYSGKRLLPAMEAFNESMSKVRTSVEWVFDDIVRSGLGIYIHHYSPPLQGILGYYYRSVKFCM